MNIEEEIVVLRDGTELAISRKPSLEGVVMLIECFVSDTLTFGGASLSVFN